MKVTINIPDEVYSELVIIAERNTRTITQEVLHRVKGFGDLGSSVSSGKSERVSEERVEHTSGKKSLPSQEVGEFKTYFKK